jgi:VWFA-related protein
MKPAQHCIFSEARAVKTRNEPVFSRRTLLLSTASLIMGNPILNLQNVMSAEGAKISVRVDIVNVFATVHDKKGKIVKDLMLEDFTLSEDSREQTLQYFSRESELPLTVGLIVDTTPSESNMLEAERNAGGVFLASILRPGTDNAFIIQYGNEVELLQDLTSSREKLEKALDHLEQHSLRSSSGARGNSGQRGGKPMGRSGADSTVLADAVFLASDEILQPQQGRKALIILGDGDHIGDRMDMAIAAAQKADAIIYAIRIYDKDFGGNGGGWRNIVSFPPMGNPGGGNGGGPGGGPSGGPGGGPGRGSGDGGPSGGPNRSDGKENLKNLAAKTGGAYFEAAKRETLEEIFIKIEEELRSQYSLGYAPDAAARSGYRKIKIGVKKKGMVVHGRDGYYAKARTGS